jgi:hypothetical protein
MAVSDVIDGSTPGQQLLRPAKHGRERPPRRLLGDERAFVIFGLTGLNAPPFEPFATLVRCDAVCL